MYPLKDRRLAGNGLIDPSPGCIGGAAPVGLKLRTHVGRAQPRQFFSSATVKGLRVDVRTEEARRVAIENHDRFRGVIHDSAQPRFARRQFCRACRDALFQRGVEFADFVGGLFTFGDVVVCTQHADDFTRHIFVGENGAGYVVSEGPTGSLVSRLGMMRDLFLSQVHELRLTVETQQILSGDLRKLLSDEYLTLLAENEERVQRPRVTQLAQRILRLIGAIFRSALQRWPAHAEQIAASIARRTQGEIRLRDVPLILRTQITDGIEEFLWVETSNEIEGALRALLAEHRSTVDVEPVRLERETYREFASACWKIIAEHC